MSVEYLLKAFSLHILVLKAMSEGRCGLHDGEVGSGGVTTV